MSENKIPEGTIILDFEYYKELLAQDIVIKDLVKEIKRLNNIINKLEEAIKNENNCYDVVGVTTRLLDKLKELKEKV